MTTTRSITSVEAARRVGFQSTLWSQVRLAGRIDSDNAASALESLCKVYWGPIYAFLRRCGHEHQNAKDLTQGFFAYLIETNLLQRADPDRGRFRSFLLGSLKFFVSNELARERALKRGGGVQIVSIEFENDDGLLPNEPVMNITPEQLFDRKWARSVLAEAMDRLAQEYHRAGQEKEFALLQPHLTGDAETHLPRLAAQTGKSAGAMRVTLFRLRNRFRRLIREVIADTVSDPAQVESELQHLEAALRAG